MIIEIVGVPGAGKSTLSDKIAEGLPQAVIDLGARRDLRGRTLGVARRRIWWAIAAASRPRLAVPLLRGGRKDPFLSRQVLEVLRRDLLLRRLARTAGPHLVDEGAWHALMWSLALLGYDHFPAAVHTRLYQPDTFIRVRRDHQDSLRAIAEEGGRESLAVRGESDIRDAMQRYDALVDQLSIRRAVIDASASDHFALHLVKTYFDQ